MNNLVLTSASCKATVWVFSLLLLPFLSFAQLGNDACGSATTISSSTTCITTGGTVVGATYTTITNLDCGDANRDVWYSFVAQSTNPIITVTSASGRRRFQLFSGDCSNLISRFCSGDANNLATFGLTIGATYYIRVYSSHSSQTFTFNICVVDPPPPPSNDGCADAITLSPNSTCVKTMGTLTGATASGLTIPAPCNGATVPDVWYRFVATSVSTTITISDFGANFGGSKQIQLFTGSCAGLTPVTCFSGTGTSVSLASTTLSPGITYYVRVFSNSTTPPLSNADFSICITSNLAAQRFGNSYVNVTKKTTGGVVEPGDILEIRMTVNHTAGTMYNMRYLDNVPTNTEMLTGGNDRISVITNEGVAIQNYSLTPGDDAATYLATPPAGEHQIRMNLGFGTTTTPSPAISAPINNSETEAASATGQAVASTHIPRGGGGMLFAISFRVRVTGNVGDVITLGAGKFIYRTSAGGTDIILPTTPYQISISAPMSLCANATGVNMSQEFGGTFGSGSTLNRSTDLTFPIPGYTFTAISATQSLGDGQYAIVKNMSPRSGTNRDAQRSPNNTIAFPNELSSTYRMHGGHWDIDGDHTGTGDDIGNIPQADGVSGGYMLMVNADYVASETYRQTLTNLCPNTYYEFSAWFRNICPTCGADYTTGSNYTPRQPGVLPNLTFALDGIDRYNTGEIPYMNVNNNSGGWVKKGFVFITGPTQTTATLSIRNNSQGGGGNDWAMDDITVATCLPSMTYTPTLNPIVCESTPITINNTMRSYFSNYTYYKWQKSTNGGTTWADVPGQRGSAAPASVNGQWEYTTSYTIPSSETTMANNSDRYRQIVATTEANLDGSTCQATDGVSIISLNVVPNCIPLSTDLLSLTGRLINNHAQLSWTTSKEEEQFRFVVEKSTDGIHYNRIETINGYNLQHAEKNHYSYTDPIVLSGMANYRIAMIDMAGKIKYSRTIRLGNKVEVFNVNVTTNPFDKHLSFSVSVEKDAKIEVMLLDARGNVVKSKGYIAYEGLNNFSIQQTNDLAAGIYILQVRNQEKTLSTKLMKK
jgi:hypothetical protein